MATKDKVVLFRVDPGTYRQIEGEARRRGLTVSAYARLMCTIPLTKDGAPETPSMREALNAWAKELQLCGVPVSLVRLQQATENIIASQRQLDEATRWLFNAASVLDLAAQVKEGGSGARAGHEVRADTPHVR